MDKSARLRRRRNGLLVYWGLGNPLGEGMPLYGFVERTPERSAAARARRLRRSLNLSARRFSEFTLGSLPDGRMALVGRGGRRGAWWVYAVEQVPPEPLPENRADRCFTLEECVAIFQRAFPGISKAEMYLTIFAERELAKVDSDDSPCSVRP